MSTRHHKHATPARSVLAGPTAALPARSAGDPNRTARSVSADDVRFRAYRKWEDAGKPAGDGVRFWLEAEQEFAQGE